MTTNQLQNLSQGYDAISSCVDGSVKKHGILVLKFNEAVFTVTASPDNGIIANCFSDARGSDCYRLAPEQYWECIEDWLGNMMEWLELNDEPEVTFIHLWNANENVLAV